MKAPGRETATALTDRDGRSLPPGLEPVLQSGGPDVPVRALMTPGVVSVVEDASVREAFRSISIHHVHAVLVVARHSGRPLGWVTAHGLLDHSGEKSSAWAREAITAPAVYVEPTATARQAGELMLDRRVSHLLVGFGPAVPPQGVVSDYDLARLASI